MIKRVLLSLSGLALGLVLLAIAATGFGSISVFGWLTATLLAVGAIAAVVGTLVREGCGSPGQPCL